MALLISILALVSTIYQLYLQRVHNEKSLKPLVQINLTDQDLILAVDVQNNGLGPFTIDALNFSKDGQCYSRIRDCLTFEPRQYEYVDIRTDNKKGLGPGGRHQVFFKKFDVDTDEKEMDSYKTQLSVITVKVEGRDIYGNKVVAQRNLTWFARYIAVIH